MKVDVIAPRDLEKLEDLFVPREHRNTWWKKNGSPGDTVFGRRLRVGEEILPTDVYKSSDGTWSPWGDRGPSMITEYSAVFVRPSIPEE